MENLLSVKEKIKNVNRILQNLDKDGFSLIEKDIILQEIRELYTLVNNLDIIEQNTIEPVNKIAKNDSISVEDEQETKSETASENIVEFLDSEPVEEKAKELEEIVETPVKAIVVEEEPQELVEIEKNPVKVADNVSSNTQVKPKLTKPVPEQQNLFGNNRQNGVVTIGEQLGQNRTSLNKSLSSNANSNDVSSRFGQKPISDIKAAIGIGDRFLYIRELFNGNNDEFEQTLVHLNSLNSYEEADNYLKGKYNWDYSQETVSNFVGVVKRKYL